MSIVCTLEPKVNLFKGAATKNLLVLKNNTVKSAINTTITNDTLKNYNSIALPKDKTFSVKHNNIEHAQLSHHHLQVQHHQSSLQQHQLQQHSVEKPRISVVEFVARQHSNDSNLSAELLNCSRFVAAMPEVLSVATANSNNINNNNHHKSKLTTLGVTTTAATTHNKTTTNMNNVRMSSISPSLSMNGSSNEATNVHGLPMYGGPMSPQSSDSGHSLSDSMTPHMNGSGGNYYDNMTKQQQHNHHKELFSQRKQREFTPDNKKDDSYWDRRRRNNEAAKRSREKRRYNDMVLEQRVVELTKENHVLKAQLDAIRDKFNISGENLVSVEQILASLPTSEQVLSITKRAKIAPAAGNGSFNAGPGVPPPASVASAINYVPPPPANAAAAAANNAASSVSHASAIAPASPPQKSNNLSQAVVAAQEAAQQVIKTVGHPHISTSSLGSTHPHVISPSIAQQHHMQLTPPPHVSQYQQQQQQHHASHLDSAYGHAMGPIMSVAAGSTTSAHLESARQMQQQLSGVAPPAPSNLQNLHVLQALNRNVSSDDLDNLRKVVAVVGAITTAGNPAAAGELPPSVSALYSGASAHYAAPPAPQTAPVHYAYGKEAMLPTVPSHDIPSYHLPSTEGTVSSSAGESVSSSCLGGSAAAVAAAGSVLNLSRRACSPTYEHMLSSTTSNCSPSSRLSSSLSSASSSGAISGDDEHDAADDVDVENNQMVSISTTSPSSIDSNNCLPLKLRHKSHLGDKDAAATALLALQHIKQEPISNRASPPAWADNGDNSSDERDSGISIGSAEWTAQFQRKAIATPKPMGGESSAAPVGVLPAEREHLLKSKLARLESEVASIKNMMILSAEPTAELKI